MADPGLASKFVEAQIEDAERAASERKRDVNGLSPIETERRESLRQSISRTHQLLEAARTATQRKMLMKALRSLEGMK